MLAVALQPRVDYLVNLRLYRLFLAIYLRTANGRLSIFGMTLGRLGVWVRVGGVLGRVSVFHIGLFQFI